MYVRSMLFDFSRAMTAVLPCLRVDIYPQGVQIQLKMRATADHLSQSSKSYSGLGTTKV